MKHSQKYQDNSTKLISDLLESDVKELVNLFLIDASINMGTDFTNETLERVIEIVLYEYKYLPLYAVASAFKAGSMGKFDKGRLVPRTIFGWLKEVSDEHHRKEHHNEVHHSDFMDAMDLNDYPAGSAICKKIDWYRNGTLKMKDWDNIPLKDIAEQIKAGHHVSPQMFGIIYKT